ncbi:MAG: hypothetical protein IPM46_01145 [Flavobacteriales bacterium]|nr:hypothetical protein [Flavobacteriales bacterium]
MRRVRGTGMQVGWSLTNDFWRYDSFSQTWSPSTTLPASPRQYCTAQSLFSQGYLFGGLDASGPLSELWSFDSGSQSWIQRASLPGAGRYACDHSFWPATSTSAEESSPAELL